MTLALLDFSDLKSTIFKFGIAETETELVSRRDFFLWDESQANVGNEHYVPTHRIEMAIINLQSFFIRDANDILVGPIVQDKLRPIILDLLRDGIWQLSAWVPLPIQHIRNRIASLIALESSPHDSRNIRVIRPLLDDQRAHRVHNDNRVVVLSRNGLDESITSMPGSEVLTVAHVSVDDDILFTGIAADKDEGSRLASGHAGCAGSVEVVEDP